VKGNLVRLTWALALVASMALTIGAGLRWTWPMKRYLKAQTFRALMVLSAIASSALVIEAGQRWK